jgi:hypothetical protein
MPFDANHISINPDHSEYDEVSRELTQLRAENERLTKELEQSRSNYGFIENAFMVAETECDNLKAQLAMRTKQALILSAGFVEPLDRDVADRIRALANEGEK